jgi:DNA-directed RNA polymerase sigma subunit (sigma70/sigma32)|tara:strand:+ start:42543 stop:42794 length:252 start_codon:yes stop_codon:yes gene_type:complete
MSDESSPCGESCACNVEEPDEEQHRMWIDYPEDNNCALKSIEKHGAMTLAEVAKRLGISIVRVSQIEKQALKKLSKRIKYDFS